MTKLIFEPNKISEKTSEMISKSINKVLEKKELAIIGIVGGESISKVLDNIKNFQVEWRKVHIFMVDERLVPIDHPDSNFKMISKKLSNIILKENLHPYILKNNEKDYGLSEYQDEIKQYSNNCDIVIVSSGEDGHIGSLFPNHPSIIDDSNYFVFVDNSPKPPSRRISMSKNMILRSQIGFLLVNGNNKKEAYKKFLDENIDYTICPSKLINMLPESYVLTDIKLTGDEL